VKRVTRKKRKRRGDSVKLGKLRTYIDGLHLRGGVPEEITKELNAEIGS